MCSKQANRDPLEGPLWGRMGQQGREAECR